MDGFWYEREGGGMEIASEELGCKWSWMMVDSGGTWYNGLQ